MTRLEKITQCLNEFLPDANEKKIKEGLFTGDCDICLICGYCDEYFWLKENGEYLLDEDGDRLNNPDMSCADIVNQWLHEEC